MTISEIEQAIKELSPKELSRLRAWFEGFDAQEWDKQIERDANSGKLDKIAEKALKEYRVGKAKEL
jgi:hypothetical protein